jgi:hypothetical protein
MKLSIIFLAIVLMASITPQQTPVGRQSNTNEIKEAKPCGVRFTKEPSLQDW